MSRMPETIVVGPDPDPATVRAAAVCVVGNCGPDRDVLEAIGVLTYWGMDTKRESKRPAKRAWREAMTCDGPSRFEGEW